MSAMEVEGDGAGSGADGGGGVEAPSAVGAQLPPHLQDRHDYLTSGADMNFNVRTASGPACTQAHVGSLHHMQYREDLLLAARS
jgi:hypothetical protein